MNTTVLRAACRSILGGVGGLFHARTPPSPSITEPVPPSPVAAYPYMDFPVLTASHVRHARLYSDRAEMFRAFALPQGGIIGEVGVAVGWVRVGVGDAWFDRSWGGRLSLRW